MKKSKVIMLLTNPCIIDPRVEQEAYILSENGYEVEILAWDRLCKYESYEKRKNYKIIRIKVKSGYSKGLKQIFKLLLFYFETFKYISKQKNIIIHCNDLDTLPLGYFLKLLFKFKLVYDAHEIYSEMIFKNIFLKKACESFEKFLLKKVDIFFTVGEIRKQWYENNNYLKSPVILGNYKSKLKIKLNINAEKKKISIQNKIIILYIGSLNKERMLLEIVEAVKNDKRFMLLIAGEGMQKQTIVKSINNADNIKYLGFIDNQKLLDYYNFICDVIYYGLYEDYAVSKTAVPNKMYEAISYDKIFLCSKTGEMEIINNMKNTFIFIEDLIENLNFIYKLIHTKRLRNKLTENNKYFYNLYNNNTFKKILVDYYALL